MATTRRSTFGPVPWPLVAILGIVLLFFIKVSKVNEDDAEKKPVTVTVPQTKDPAPKIIDELISNFNTHAVVIRSGDWEYVSMNGAVFCRRGDKLLGVYNKSGAVWQASTE
jgi:hypothetical protein